MKSDLENSNVNPLTGFLDDIERVVSCGDEVALAQLLDQVGGQHKGAPVHYWKIALETAARHDVAPPLIRVMDGFARKHQQDWNRPFGIRGLTFSHCAWANALKTLHELGVDLNRHCNLNVHTPLTHRCAKKVAQTRTVDEIRTLVALGVDLERPDATGLKPLENLVLSSFHETEIKHQLLEILIEAGADLHVKDKNGRGIISRAGSLHDCMMSSTTPVLLMRHGYVPDEADLKFATHLCIARDDLTSLESLLSSGLGKGARPGDLLLYAIQHTRPRIFMWLLENGWSPDEPTEASIFLSGQLNEQFNCRDYLRLRLQDSSDENLLRLNTLLQSWEARQQARAALDDILKAELR